MTLIYIWLIREIMAFSGFSRMIFFTVRWNDGLLIKCKLIFSFVWNFKRNKSLIVKTLILFCPSTHVQIKTFFIEK